MSEALKSYESGGELYFQGRLLAEISKVTITDMSQNTEVNTTVHGLAGMAAGPLKAELSWDSAMPKAGMEADYYRALKLRLNCTVRVKAAGVTETYTVRLDSRDRSFDVSGAASVTVKATGKQLGATF